jgi:RNA polymerase sigma-70 factor (ECF subfamily)
MEWNTTSTVLEKLRDYDEKTAWELLDRHFQGALVQFGARMGLTPADSQDAAQETLIAFAQAYREGNYDKEKGRLKHWLFGIAKRQCLKVRHKLSRQRERGQIEQREDSQPLEQIAAEGDALASLWEEEWRRMVYARALECVRTEVTPETFEIFQQVVFQGRSNDEVAASFGVDRAKVYDAKYRVTRRLAQLAGEYEDA